MEEERNVVAEGEKAYNEWREQLLADPEARAIYEEEAEKSVAGVPGALQSLVIRTPLKIERKENRTYGLADTYGQEQPLL